MQESTMKLLHSDVRITATELAEAVGIDLETVNNWLRREIIRRAPIGGRQRSRLFSATEVYIAALINELVKLGIPPSSASEAANAIWKEWDRQNIPEGPNLYALVWLTKDKWTVALCPQRFSGAQFNRKSIEEMYSLKHAFVAIPFFDVLERVSAKVADLLG
jgi:hypothetical protein